jgi:hypothetical protein
LHCVRDDKEACHRLKGVIEVHELVIPYSTVIQAFPLSVRSLSLLGLITVVELASEIIDGNYAEDKVEKKTDDHDCDDPRDCYAEGLDAYFQALILGDGSKGPQYFEQSQRFD